MGGRGSLAPALDLWERWRGEEGGREGRGSGQIYLFPLAAEGAHPRVPVKAGEAIVKR